MVKKQIDRTDLPQQLLNKILSLQLNPAVMTSMIHAEWEERKNK
jgi:hypothetical protein